MRWFKKMACKVNGSLWINDYVNFNRDFTIHNPIASKFYCKTIVLKKVCKKKLYNIKSTKSIFYTLYITIISVPPVVETAEQLTAVSIR